MKVPCRYVLVLWTFSLSVLLYVDRICISTAKRAIAADLGFDDVQMGWVLASFALGYALFQTVGGWLADRLGPRTSLSAIVVFWSVFTGLTAAASNYGSMLLTRFLFGAGEAGAFPGVARANYSWIPPVERGIVQGINSSGSRLGGAMSLIVLPLMIARLGWRGSFVALMFLGFGWAVGWFWWFRNDPASHPAVSLDELALITADHKQTAESSTPDVAADQNKNHDQQSDQSTTERQPSLLYDMLQSSNLWLISAQYFSSNFTFFFCLTWLFPHLSKTYQLTDLQAGMYSAVTLVCGAIGNWFGGWLVDRIYRAGHWRASRRNPAILGFALAAIGLLCSVYAQTPFWSIVWFSLAVFGADMTISPSWAFCIDIGQSQAGIVSGTMNMAGNLGSFVTALAFPYLAKWTGTNTPFFFVGATLCFVAIPTWMLVDPRRPLRSHS